MATPAEQLQQRLNFLINKVGLNIPQSRINGWKKELARGNGRSLEQLWDDVLFHVGGAQQAKIEEWVARQFERAGNKSVGAQRLQRIAQEIINGDFTFQEKRQQIFDAEGYTPGKGEDPPLKEDVPKEEKRDEEGIGDEGTEEEPGLTILHGPHTWYFDKSTGKWYIGYHMPGSNRQLLFEASPEDMNALFGEGKRPANYQRTRLADLLKEDRYHFGGDIGEMEGTGSFRAEYQAMLARSLDAGRLPDWAQQSEAINDLLFIAQSEGWSDTKLLDEISKTRDFKQRFPGIQKFRDQGNLSIGEAVGAFLEMEAGLRNLNKQYRGDGGGGEVDPSVIGALLNKGYSMSQIEDTYAVFDRMSEYAPALEAFNEVLDQMGYPPMSKGDQVKFLKGQAPQEIYDIYEASAIQEEVAGAGLDEFFSAQDAIDAALESAGSRQQGQIAQQMQQAAALVLRYRNQLNLDTYGIDQEDIINMSLGVPPEAGGKTEAEIREALSSAAQAARGFIEQQSRPYTGFSDEGVPRAQSLGRSRRRR